VATWFSVSDDRAECAIDNYLISAVAAIDFDTVFETINYLNDGNVNIVTDLLPVETPTAEFQISIVATHSSNVFADSLTLGATITVGCYGITTQSVTYAPNAAYPFVFEDPDYPTSIFTTLLQDGSNAYQFFMLSRDLLTISTDQADCNWHDIQHVTDNTGATVATDSAAIRFQGDDAGTGVDSINNFQVLMDQPFFGQLYFRVNSFDPDIFTVIEVTVTNCIGGQTLVVNDPADPFFDIYRAQAPITTFETFDITGLFEAEVSGVVPQGKCPLTGLKVCADGVCATELLEVDGFRVVNDTGLATLSVEIDMEFIYVPQITLYLQLTAQPAILYQPFLLLVEDCSVQIISLAGEAALGPILRTLNKNEGLQSLFTAAEVATWFSVNDTRAECAIDFYYISAVAATDFDTVFDTANYINDGNVNIVTDLLPVETPTAEFQISVVATHS